MSGLWFQTSMPNFIKIGYKLRPWEGTHAHTQVRWTLDIGHRTTNDFIFCPMLLYIALDRQQEYVLRNAVTVSLLQFVRYCCQYIKPKYIGIVILTLHEVTWPRGDHRTRYIWFPIGASLELTQIWIRSFNHFKAISIQRPKPKKIWGHVTLATPPFRKKFKGHVWTVPGSMHAKCELTQVTQIWIRSFNHFKATSI